MLAPAFALILALILALVAPAAARWHNDLCPPGDVTPSLPPGIALPTGTLNFVVVARGVHTYNCTEGTALSTGYANTYDVGCILALPPLFGAVAPVIPRLALDGGIAYPQIGAIPQLALEITETPEGVLTATDPATDFFVTLNISARVAAPRVGREIDLDWASFNAVGGDLDFGTEALRTYTAGGFPDRCRRGRTVEVQYAALYWFYMYRGLQKVFVPHALHVARTASRP